MNQGTIRITTLGSMGWIPVRRRQTCCYAMEYRDRLIVLDAGTGLARFMEPRGQAVLNRYDTIYLLLSHFHLDHIAGLIYLPAIFREKTVHIAAPGQPVYPCSGKDSLAMLIRPPYFSRPLDDFPLSLHFRDLQIGMNDLDGIAVETILQPHSDPSLGIKIGQAVCYLTDTPCREASLDFCRGARLLLHEAWLDEQDHHELETRQSTSIEARKTLISHSHAAAVADLASKADVDSLLLIHLNPAYDDSRLMDMEQFCRHIFPASRLARDGQSLEV